MKTYRPRALVDGTHEFPRELQGKKLVALVDHVAKEGRFVEFDGQIMEIAPDRKPIFWTGPYKDKFGGPDYSLFYYAWEPDRGQEKLL